MASRPPKKPALTLDASLVQDDVPMMVIPKIYVGSIHSAFNLDCMLDFGITHILNASRLPVTFPRQFTYLSAEIRDRGVSNILSCIPTTNIFIEAGIDNGGVLVHCFGGKSRSPAFIAAYLMSSYKWSFDRAYSVIKDARSVIDINPGFECQLRAYAAANYDVYVAQQLLLRSRIRELHELRGQDMVLSGECKVSEHVGYSHAITATSKYNDYLAANYNGSSAAANTNTEVTVKKLAHLRNNPSDNTGDVGSPNIKFGATAATYDATAVNTEHEHFSSTGQKRAFSHENRISLSPGSGIDMDEAGGDDMEMDTDYHEERTIQNLAAAAAASQSGSRPNSRMQPMAVVTGDISPENVCPDDEQMENAFGNYSASPNTIASAMTMEYPVNPQPAEESGNAQGQNSSPTMNSTGGGGPMLMRSDRSDNSGGRTSRHSKKGNGRSGRRGRRSSGSSNEVEVRTPTCRLSRPGSSWVRVIPPLRGLERELKCSWCNTTLFTLANIIRPDMDILHLLNHFNTKCSEEMMEGCSPAPSGFADTFMNVGLKPNISPRAEPVALRVDPSADSKTNIGSNERSAFVKSPKALQLPLVNINSGSRPSSARVDIGNYFADGECTPRRAAQLLLHSEEKKESGAKESPPDPPLNSELFAIRTADTHLPPIHSTRASHIQHNHPVQQPIAQHPSRDSSSSGSPNGRLSSRSMEMELEAGNGQNLLRSESSKTSSETATEREKPAASRPVPRTYSSGMRTSRAGQSKGFDFDIPLVEESEEKRTSVGTSANTSTSTSISRIPQIPEHAENTFVAPLSGSRPGSAKKAMESTAQMRGSTPTKSSPQYILDSLSEDSPRVSIPPHRLNEKASLTLRPQSAERQRWLARMNLLREGDSKLVKMAEEDDKASETTVGQEKYYHIEYLDWMGTEIFDPSKDNGELLCFNCKNILGLWTWKPSEKMSLDGRLEAPLFRVHKHVVHHCDVSFDATPSSTPRPEDMMASASGYSMSRSGSHAFEHS